MPIDHVDSWSQFGLPGLVIAALFALLCFLVKEHRAERQEWITAYREQSRLADDRQSETNGVIRELAAVIRESNARRRATD
jgi:hypothetical protein